MQQHNKLATMTIDLTADEIQLFVERLNWMAVEGCEAAAGEHSVDMRPYDEILPLLHPGVSEVPQKFADNLLQVATRLMGDANLMADEGFPFEDCESRVELAQKLEEAAGRSTETPSW